MEGRQKEVEVTGADSKAVTASAHSAEIKTSCGRLCSHLQTGGIFVSIGATVENTERILQHRRRI